MAYKNKKFPKILILALVFLIIGFFVINTMVGFADVPPGSYYCTGGSPTTLCDNPVWSAGTCEGQCREVDDIPGNPSDCFSAYGECYYRCVNKANGTDCTYECGEDECDMGDYGNPVYVDYESNPPGTYDGNCSDGICVDTNCGPRGEICTTDINCKVSDYCDQDSSGEGDLKCQAGYLKFPDTFNWQNTPLHPEDEYSWLPDLDACEDGLNNDCDTYCDYNGCCSASVCSDPRCNNKIECIDSDWGCGATWTLDDQSSCNASSTSFCYDSDPAMSEAQCEGGVPFPYKGWFYYEETGEFYCVFTDDLASDPGECSSLSWGVWITIDYIWYGPDPDCAPCADPSGDKLFFRDGAGPNNVAVLGSTNGNMAIRGVILDNQGSISSNNEDFVVKNGAGSVVAMLDKSSGDFYFTGNFNPNQDQAFLNGFLADGLDDFIVVDSAGDVLMSIDGSGNMFLRGCINESVLSP